MDKDKAKYQTVDEYIKAFPKDVQGVLKKMRQTIKEAAPGAIETISYQIPTFKLNGKGLVYFAAFQSHIGFYPIHAGVEGFEKEPRDAPAESDCPALHLSPDDEAQRLEASPTPG